MKTTFNVHICLLFCIIFLFENSNCVNQRNLTAVFKWNVTKFIDDNNEIHECKNCMPAGIKVTQNETIFISFPRWKEGVNFTFGKLINHTDGQYVFQPWPSLKENNDTLKSVLGFEIFNDTIYLLDQGRVNNKEPAENDIKLLKYNFEGKLLNKFVFNETLAPKKTAFLNDLVIHEKNKLIFITDSGIPIDEKEDPKPSLIYLNITSDKIDGGRILENDPSLMPDSSFWLHINGSEIRKKNPMRTGVDGIALSCDGRALYFCPLTSRMIYSVDVSEMFGEKTPTIYSTYKHMASDGLISGAKGNLYMTSLESGSIYVARDVKEDVSKLHFHSLEEVVKGNETTMWPDTLSIYNGDLYFVSNQYNNYDADNIKEDPGELGSNYRIYKIKIEEDSYLGECKLKASIDAKTIIVWVVFGLVVLVVLSFVLMSSHKQEESIDRRMSIGLTNDL